jgi:hypothetical protein
MNDLETVLLQLTGYGRPKLVRMDQGWWCYCEMFVMAKGAAVRVESEITHPLPAEAAHECLQRVVACVHGISKLVDQKALSRA